MTMQPITLDTVLGWIRPSILRLTPYSSARGEFSGQADVLLDANESPFDNGMNRYPDPKATIVREALAELRGIDPSWITIGNGSDELVDHITRVFCEPKQDAVIYSPPTFGMYKVAAGIQDVRAVEIPLTPDFQLPTNALLEAADEHTKILWICTPNNPSGNDFPRHDVEYLIRSFPGLVVVDEAYIDFLDRPSYLERIAEHPNLVVLQTLSKGWGLAGIRVGAAFARPEVIRYLQAVKMPYNVNSLTQQTAAKALRNPEHMQAQVDLILAQRHRLEAELPRLDVVEHIYPSDTNYLLVRFREAEQVYRYLQNNGLVVRSRTRDIHCAGCLRVTAGLPEENDRLLELLAAYESTVSA